MNAKNPWPAVVISCCALGCVTVLAALHADTTVIMTAISAVAVPVTGFLLYGQVQAVKEQTNGNTSRQMDLVDSLVEHLKTLAPPPATPPIENPPEAPPP